MRPERPRPRPRRSGGRRPAASPPRGGDGRGGETPRRRTGSISQRLFSRLGRASGHGGHAAVPRTDADNAGTRAATVWDDQQLRGAERPEPAGASARRAPRSPTPRAAARRRPAARAHHGTTSKTRPRRGRISGSGRGAPAQGGRGLRGRPSEDGARATTPSRGTLKTARERNAPKRRSAPGVSRACAACYAITDFARLGRPCARPQRGSRQGAPGGCRWLARGRAAGFFRTPQRPEKPIKADGRPARRASCAALRGAERRTFARRDPRLLRFHVAG